MKKSMQLWLSRLLRTRSVTPVGGTEAQRIDLRLICGCDRDLRQAVSARIKHKGGAA